MGLNTRINFKLAMLLISLFTVIVFGAGFSLTYKYWLKTDKRNVYELKMDLLKEQLQKNPLNEEVQLDLALSLYLDGQSEQALSNYQKVLKLNPKNITALLYLGLIKVDLKQYQDAIPYLEKVVSVRPDFMERLLYYNLGIAYLNTNNYQKARDSLNIASGIDPGSAHAKYSLGVTYFKLKQYDKAKLFLEQAIKIGGPIGDANRILEVIKNAANKNNIKKIHKQPKVVPTKWPMTKFL